MTSFRIGRRRFCCATNRWDQYTMQWIGCQRGCAEGNRVSIRPWIRLSAPKDRNERATHKWRSAESMLFLVQRSTSLLFHSDDYIPAPDLAPVSPASTPASRSRPPGHSPRRVGCRQPFLAPQPIHRSRPGLMLSTRGSRQQAAGQRAGAVWLRSARYRSLCLCSLRAGLVQAH
jgi:hypothetical protein